MAAIEEFTWNYQDEAWYAPDLDPNDELDYLIDFSQIMDAGDTIASAQVTATNVTVSASSNTTNSVTLWLVFGVLNAVGIVSVKVTTTGGRTYDREFRVRIKDL